jgi:DNA-directed RNA polymerase subunit delta
VKGCLVMSIKLLEKEQLKEMSMIELAYEILKEEKITISYADLLKQVASLKGMKKDLVKKKIGYLYTNLNIDGRFVCLGDNMWGLKTWYPMEKLEEDIITQKPKKKVRKSKKEVEIDDDFDDFDDTKFDEIEDELTDLVEDDDDDDFEEEDLNELTEDDDDDTKDSDSKKKKL